MAKKDISAEEQRKTLAKAIKDRAEYLRESGDQEDPAEG